MAEDGSGSNPTISAGIVKWFNGWKGFGFITPDDPDSDDIFVHQTSIRFDGFRTLYEGQRVNFHVSIGDDGRTRASDVVPIRRSGPGARGRARGLGSGVECYNCGRFGHLARDCYFGGGRGGARGSGGRRGEYYGGRGRRGGYYGGGGGDGGGGRGGGGGGGRGECYSCGEEGHFARDCRNTEI